jgi:hypothetical protein
MIIVTYVHIYNDEELSRPMILNEQIDLESEKSYLDLPR